MLRPYSNRPRFGWLAVALIFQRPNQALGSHEGDHWVATDRAALANVLQTRGLTRGITECHSVAIRTVKSRTGSYSATHDGTERQSYVRAFNPGVAGSSPARSTTENRTGHGSQKRLSREGALPDPRSANACKRAVLPLLNSLRGLTLQQSALVVSKAACVIFLCSRNRESGGDFSPGREG